MSQTITITDKDGNVHTHEMQEGTPAIFKDIPVDLNWIIETNNVNEEGYVYYFVGERSTREERR